MKPNIQVMSDVVPTGEKSAVVALSTSGAGPLTPEEIKALAAKLDGLIKFKNPILEVIDGLAFTLFLRGINDLAIAKLPPEIQAILADVLRDLIAAE